VGATYLSLHLRTTDRAAVIAALEALAAADPAAGLGAYVAEPADGWIAVFPTFTPALERVGKALSGRLSCLAVLLLSADEDELYCLFFRDGRQLPWCKIGLDRRRRGKERERLAEKLEPLAEVCDADQRARLLDLLADTTGVVFSSDLLRAFAETAGIRNAFSSFLYLERGEREGLASPDGLVRVPAAGEA
jgi:hypothetical protein